MTTQSSIGGLLFVVLSLGLVTGLPPVASAEERVLGSWIAKGRLFSVGERKTFFQGHATGVVHHSGGKGQLDTAKLDCSISMRVEDDVNKKEGNGFCTFVTSSGGEIYASFKCAGPAKKTCDGTLTHLDGTGPFKGISGETDLRMKSQIFWGDKKSAMSGKFAEVRESSDLSVRGYMVMPNLTYSLPEQAKQS